MNVRTITKDTRNRLTGPSTVPPIQGAGTSRIVTTEQKPLDIEREEREFLASQSKASAEQFVAASPPTGAPEPGDVRTLGTILKVVVPMAILWYFFFRKK